MNAQEFPMLQRSDAYQRRVKPWNSHVAPPLLCVLKERCIVDDERRYTQHMRRSFRTQGGFLWLFPECYSGLVCTAPLERKKGKIHDTEVGRIRHGVDERVEKLSVISDQKRVSSFVIEKNQE